MNDIKELDWTGERLVTKISNHYGTIEHLHRYAIALDLCCDKVVLDIASGEGYGTNLISTKAKKVYGVDISEEAIKHAKEKYTNPNITFQIGSASLIPIEDYSIDVVISFETIEHHDEHEKMMLEIRRVLKPSGILIISSPEKEIYHDRDPNNPFHIKELTSKEFTKLISKHFEYYRLYNQRYVTGSIVSDNNTDISGVFRFYDGNFETITNILQQESFFNKPFFNLIICSNSILNLDSKLCVASFFNGYNVYDFEIKALKDAINISSINLENVVNKYKNSKAYRLGKFILAPLQMVKSIFSSKK
jgi:ubiquinone/menaquinone biosynthesis C-methylase UbiE